jgi:hypothetical protein
MTYDVGTHIDLRYLNSGIQGAEFEPAVHTRSHDRLYESGTTFKFLKMKAGLIVTSITEPTIALRVSVV